jgi:hypothetical protein
MSTGAQGSSSGALLARRVREHFVAHLEGMMLPLSDATRARLAEALDQGTNMRDMHERRDTLMTYEKQRGAWVRATPAALRRALVSPAESGRAQLSMSSLSLIGDDVVEKKILASRLAQTIQDKASWEINDLKLRMQELEGGQDWASTDVLRPEVVAQVLVEQWGACQLPPLAWELAKDVIGQQVVKRCLEAYQQVNQILIGAGVMPEVDLRNMVKRTPGNPAGGGASAAPTKPAAPQTPAQPSGSSYGASGNVPMPGGGAPSTRSAQPGAYRPTPSSRSAAQHDEETRMLTAGTPLGRARQRAQGILGQLRRMLTERVAGFDGSNPPTRPSPALAQAMAQHQETQPHHYSDVSSGAISMQGGAQVGYDTGDVQQAAVVVRERSAELKKKASTSSEKATIEIVALMFQAILAEDRIPAAVRVWFARLQMPVLRVALSEPEFFGTLQHPARQLIDRMGSCVMGFDASAIGGSALEIEIKRVVQVIEQYPETGRRVFQLVYDEFQKFLSKFLTEKGNTQRLVTVAQQVEQKETMAIQYTIEMRKMLNNMPVRDELREFLFKVWAEVLAIAAVKNGPQHADTLSLKKTATDLLWAASAKPNRDDRNRVIQDLPNLLQRLRQGMTLLGVQGPAQENHIKVVGEILADAFLSKTEAVPRAQIDAMANRLANLEDFISDDPAGDLPLDNESVEMILGIDASMIEVVADGGSNPSAAMLAWAEELQLGNWFSLDHNGTTTQVQYSWRSDRKQLHLFASADGRSFLIQARRLASYLQAGLLLPTEEELLTVRATRDAMAKLEANPERLLA